jgi:class 3 adenylate cyclase
VTAVVSEVTVDCRSDACTVWGAVADTERLNRLLGMSRIEVRPESGASAARYRVSTTLGGFAVEYEERPFEWIYPKSFKVLRKMRAGPLDALEIAFTLDPLPDGGTRVRIRLALTPRYFLLGPFVRLMANRTTRAFSEIVAGLDTELAGGAAQPAPRRGALHTSAFDRAAAELVDAERGRRAVAERVIAEVRDGADLDVSRMRPFALADDWKEDRRAVLGVCLSAVRAGLLDLRWEVVCPSCRTATEVLPSLASLSEHGACQLCELEFALDLEDAVEATFAPAAAVREVDVGPYCIGGPARTPHVLAQAVLPAGGEARLACPPDEGRYRLFVRGGKAAPVEVKAGAPREVRVEAEAPGAAPIEVAPEGALLVRNPGAEERHAKIERLGWAEQAARARFVTSMPGFRRDFASDVLRPGLALKIARVGLFFSDLTGSTKLYADAGDAAAFKLVQDHFDVVIKLVEEGRGTLVKTIGDAVMAVFADDLDGLVASVALLHAFDAFRREGEHRSRTNIKLGVYGGPCYVVTANGVLDYFGQTVNVAARLQGEARSGELVVEADLADRAVAAKALPEAFVVERYDAKLKGIPHPVRAARIRVPGAGGEPGH